MAQSTAAAHSAENGHGTQDKQFWALAVGSIGVVYGDIGTSPLYALREAVKGCEGARCDIAPTPLSASCP